MASFGNQIFGVSFVGITGLESSIFVGQISTVARDTASLAAEILASNNLNWRGSCISGSWGFNIKSSVVNWVALTESYMCVCVEFGCLADPALPCFTVSPALYRYFAKRFAFITCWLNTELGYLQVQPCKSRKAWNIRRRNDFCITNIIDDTLYKHRYNIRYIYISTLWLSVT